jgi:hypothetical protein
LTTSCSRPMHRRTCRVTVETTTACRLTISSTVTLYSLPLLSSCKYVMDVQEEKPTK